MKDEYCGVFLMGGSNRGFNILLCDYFLMNNIVYSDLYKFEQIQTFLLNHYLIFCEVFNPKFGIFLSLESVRLELCLAMYWVHNSSEFRIGFEWDHGGGGG